MGFENSVVSEETKSVEHLKALSDFKLKLTEDQIVKFDNVYNNLDSKKQDDILLVLPKVWNNIEKFLDHIDSVISKESKDNISKIFDKQRENFKDNDKILEKIYNIEEEVLKELNPYVIYNTNYTKLFQEVLLKNWNKEDKEFKYLNEMIIQKIHTIEMMKKRIWNLETELKILETKENKEKRYESLDKSFSEIKDDEKLKDIIWEKNFNNLSAWDFYAMLKSNPDKMRWLLLSTTDWNKINLDNWWDWYKSKELRVNFWKNKWLDKVIWAWDILDIENVKKIKVNWVEWERKSNPRPWYYTQTGQYLAIHNWYKIEITDTTKLVWKSEIKEFNDAKEKRFIEIRWKEISINIWSVIDNAIKNDPKAKKIENPYKSDVDKELINSLLDNNKYLEAKLDEEWNIVVWDEFNIWHLWEALSWYTKTQGKITEYLKENKNLSKDKLLELNISELWLDNNNEFLENAFKNIVKNKDVQISINSETIIIDASDSKLTVWELFSMWYEYKWNSNKHEKYTSEINAASSAYGIPSWAIIQLIYHENRAWNPNIKASWSSAYGLGQMIDDTWSRFGSWNRNDPADQLMATAKYMKHIYSNKDCSWEEVLAYYNTWEWILSWKVDINKYYNLNPAIANKIPSWIWRSNKNYFIWAIAYYNDISFDDAKLKTNI